MKTILVRGPALSRSGYGVQTRFALRALRKYEDRFNILLENIPWGQTGWIHQDDEERNWFDQVLHKTNEHIRQQLPIDISLQVTIPNEWQKVAPLNIGFTAGIETNKVSPQWIEKAALMDKIIVVSNHAKQVYENTTYTAVQEGTGQEFPFRVNTPIEVANYPVETLEKEKFDLKLDYDYNFLTVAQWGPRKNLGNTIRWFIDEFKDEEVGLVVKANVANNSTEDRFYCIEMLNQLLKDKGDRKCKIYLLHGDLTRKQMNYLYTHKKVKAYVTTTHGEGFGLPIFEAAYNGLPVIAPGWSGQNDFLYAPTKTGKQKKEKLRPLFSRVDFTMQQVPQQVVWDGVIMEDSMWCYPDEKSFKTNLRDVYTNYTRSIGKARKLKKYLLENFSEDIQYKKIVNYIYDDDFHSMEDWLTSISSEAEVHE
jgi:glycosyltransferase involved in cell wall biosynthesis